VEDFLLFIWFFPFLSLRFLADFVFIKDPIVRVSFHNNSHSYRLLLRSLFRYKIYSVSPARTVAPVRK